MGYSNRDCFWFGTEERMKWFRTPMQGADVSPEGWSSSGVLLNGGGYSTGSWGSHKNYRFEWGSSTHVTVSQEMKSYYDGTYGRGLIYFIDPNIYAYNVLPARWADPSMALGDPGAGLVYGVSPAAVSPASQATLDLPVYGSRYDLLNVPSGFRGKGDAVFIPIPEGYTLGIGVIGSASGNARVFAGSVGPSGDILGHTPLTLLPSTGDKVIADTFEGVKGIWLWVGKTATGAGAINLFGMVARLTPTNSFIVAGPGYGEDDYGVGPYGGGDEFEANPRGWMNGPWIGGMGHSGCRFEGAPTLSLTGPNYGGQAGFAAAFREVGSWNYG